MDRYYINIYRNRAKEKGSQAIYSASQKKEEDVGGGM